MTLPRDGDDYPLWLLVATKKALFRVMEDPELEDARAILEAIYAATMLRQRTSLTPAGAATPVRASCTGQTETLVVLSKPPPATWPEPPG